MEKELASLYQKIAEQLDEIVPGKWNEIYFLGEVEEGRRSWSSIFYFKVDNQIFRCTEIPSKYGVPSEMFETLLDELNPVLLGFYDCFCRNEQPLWDQIHIQLLPTGKSNVRFEYDSFAKYDGGQVLREVLWAYHTFGYVPKEGTYMHKILNKCLEK